MLRVTAHSWIPSGGGAEILRAGAAAVKTVSFEYMSVSRMFPFLLFCAAITQAQPYDVLITGGLVLDGTGNPGFYADVALRDGRIAAIGRLRWSRGHTHHRRQRQVCLSGFH